VTARCHRRTCPPENWVSRERWRVEWNDMAPPTISRDDVLPVAAGVVFDLGLAVGVPDVAVAAGVDEKLLLTWLPTPADLVRAVVDWYADLLCPPVARLTSLADLHDWADAQVMALELRQPLTSFGFAMLTRRYSSAEPGVARAVAAALERWSAALDTGLRRIRAHGELSRDADLADLADVLSAALQGGLLLARIYNDPDQLRIALAGALAQVESVRARGSD
jgi:TetR/AcrR family transcriptional repressor of nem operon